MEALDLDSVTTVLQAGHICMTLRRLKKPGSNIITSATRGLLRTGAATRAEFMSLMQGR